MKNILRNFQLSLFFKNPLQSQIFNEGLMEKYNIILKVFGKEINLKDHE